LATGKKMKKPQLNEAPPQNEQGFDSMIELSSEW
jgi:hypothetical protein